MYGPLVRDHLNAIERKHHSLIRKAIEMHLLHEPLVATRNRKPLLREVDFGADWELRCGPDNRFRIFYTADGEHSRVEILAIGVKRGSRLIIGSEEISL